MTWRLWLTAAVVSLGSLQYGFHLAELNAPMSVITCRYNNSSNTTTSYDCIPMTPQQIGVVTSVFAVGGLIGASMAGSIADTQGRKKTAVQLAILFIVGSLITAIARSVLAMSIGRVVTGVSSGAAIVVGPLYISEISPKHMRGTLGTMSQIAVNTGIFIAQILGYFLSSPDSWRRILFAGAALGLLNALSFVRCPESPQWLARNNRKEDARKALGALGLMSHAPNSAEPQVVDEAQTLLGEAIGANSDEMGDSSFAPGSSSVAASSGEPRLTPASLLSNRGLRGAALSAMAIMAIQQFSGINAIMFFGVEFLQRTLPDYSRLVNLAICVVNLGITALISRYVDRVGRRPLLLLSITGMACSAFMLVVGMGLNQQIVSAVAAMSFVISFAIGLGPIPFLIISELVPPNASGAAQSLGTAVNWISAFAIGYLFPILEAQMGSGVFSIFVVTGIVSFIFVYTRLPETKAK